MTWSSRSDRDMIDILLHVITHLCRPSAGRAVGPRSSRCLGPGRSRTRPREARRPRPRRPGNRLRGVNLHGARRRRSSSSCVCFQQEEDEEVQLCSFSSASAAVEASTSARTQGVGSRCKGVQIIESECSVSAQINSTIETALRGVGCASTRLPLAYPVMASAFSSVACKRKDSGAR